MCELPPRTRRIREHTATGERQMGTTSAHAENTHHRPRRPRRPGNYLRARGEYDAKGFDGLDKAELPPRTRRIPLRAEERLGLMGTTSAHAENTSTTPRPIGFDRNYLRARGEYAALKHFYAEPAELPPRTRRIHSHGDHFDEILGTTSAHAENTGFTAFTQAGSWNYLRARGEYAPSG